MSSTVALCATRDSLSHHWAVKRQPIPRMSEITERFRNCYTKDTILTLDYSLWSYNTENLKTQLILYRKLLRVEKKIHLPAREGDSAEVQKEKGLRISIWERSSRFIWFVDFSIPWTLHPKDWKVFAWRNLPPSSLQMTQLGRVCIGKKGFYGIFS